MTKFHNGPNGPGVCKAKKGNCPFGGDDSHFDNIEDAQEAFDKKQEAENELLPGITKEPRRSKVRGRVDGLYRGVQRRPPSFASIAESKIMSGGEAYQQLDNGDEITVTWDGEEFILNNHSQGFIERYDSVKEVNDKYEISLQVT